MQEENILGGGSDQNQGVNQEQIISGSDQEQQQIQSGTFDFTKMIGADGALSENWKDGLPENIRNERCLDSIKTIGTLAQSYVHAQHSIGASKVTIPGENASPEEWSAFYKACGRPDEESGYKHDCVNLPEGIRLDDEQMMQFRKFAFENGLSQKAFEAVLSFDVQRLQAQQQAVMAAHNAEYNETLGKLKAEFGGNFDVVIAQCDKAMETFGLTDVLRDKGLLNNYTIIKALAGIGERIGESKLKSSDTPNSANDPSARLAEIQGNPDDPYYKKDHPAHNARVSEVNGLLAAMAKAKK